MRPYVMELSGSDVERVHARMKGAEKWHFSLKIAENCRKRRKFITAYARQLLRFSRNASLWLTPSGYYNISDDLNNNNIFAKIGSLLSPRLLE